MSSVDRRSSQPSLCSLALDGLDGLDGLGQDVHGILEAIEKGEGPCVPQCDPASAQGVFGNCKRLAQVVARGEGIGAELGRPKQAEQARCIVAGSLLRDRAAQERDRGSGSAFGQRTLGGPAEGLAHQGIA